MIEKINALRKEAEDFTATSLQAVEDFRIRHLSKKGTLSHLFEEFKTIPHTEKKRSWPKAKSAQTINSEQN